MTLYGESEEKKTKCPSGGEDSASVRAVETCRIVMLVRDLTVSLFFQIHWKPPRFRLCLQFLHVSV